MPNVAVGIDMAKNVFAVSSADVTREVGLHVD